jgi:flagellar hook assembly protein FlgD
VTICCPEELPSKFSLGQNYPNPFNPSTTIEYSLAQEDNVSLEVFNILGQHIVTLVDDILPAGEYQAIWNGVDKNGIPVSSGIYLYRIRAGMYIENKKMILMK